MPIAGLLITIILLTVLAWRLRRLGQQENPTIVVQQPANTTALVVGKSNTLKRDKDGNVIGVNNDGGDIKDVLSTAIGKVLDKSDPNPMNWKHVDISTDEGKRLLLKQRKLNFLRRVLRPLDLRWIGFLRYVQISVIRTFRWGRKDNEDKYKVQPKTEYTRFAHVTGEHDIEAGGVETQKIISFNMRINITTEETYPVRVRRLVADAYAQLTVLVMERLANFMGEVDPKEFISGIKISQEVAEKNLTVSKNKLKQELIDALKHPNFVELVAKETGITIRNPSLPSFDFDDDTKKLLEAFTQAVLKADADVATAEGQKRVTILNAEAEKEAGLRINEKDADRVEIFYKAFAGNPEMVQVRIAESVENSNLTSLTYAPGANTQVPIGGKNP